MAMVDVCSLTLAFVILSAASYGEAGNTFKDIAITNETYRPDNVVAISGNFSNVSPKALSAAQTIVHTVTKFLSFGNNAEVSTARMKSMMTFMMNPYFLIPQMIMLGFAPVVLANLKLLVMKAFMMNNMALSTAFFMTIRSLVFGPSPGPQIKYVNYGYRNPHSPPQAPPPYPPRDRRSLEL